MASAASRYASWTLALRRKVLRFLVGAVEQRAASPSWSSGATLVLGGLGAKFQTGCIMCWAGSTT
eukprot:3675717-Pyramimonas_sp.AAC.1